MVRYTNFRKRTGGFAQRDAKRQRTGRSGYRKSNFRSLVRKEVLRTAETKVRTSYSTTTDLYHNSWYNGTGMMYVQQGDTMDTRSGDEIWPSFLHAKLSLNTKSDRPQVMFRCLLVKLPIAIQANSPSDWFQGSPNQLINFKDGKDITILAEKIVKCSGDSAWNSGGSGVTTHLKDMGAICELKYKFPAQKVTYDGSYPKYWNIRLLVLAYDAHGTLSTDNIADLEWCTRLYFKDP